MMHFCHHFIIVYDVLGFLFIEATMHTFNFTTVCVKCKMLLK